MAKQKAIVNGHPVVVDSTAPTIPLTNLAEDGGDIVAANAAWIANHITVLGAITSVGDGNLSGTQSMVAAHTVTIDSHTSTLSTHTTQINANTTALANLDADDVDQSATRIWVPSPTAPQTSYHLTVTGAGAISWVPFSGDGNNKGGYDDLAALIAAWPTGQVGWYATLVNPPSGPTTKAVWSGTLATWVEESPGGITAVNGDVGPSVVLDADDIDDTATTHKFATAAQLTQIATNQSSISTNAGNISTNTTDISTNTSAISTLNTTTIPAIQSDITVINGTTIPGINATISGLSGDVTTNATDIDTNTSAILLNSGKIARARTKVPLTFTSALAFNATSGMIGTVTLTGNTKPTLVTGVSVGEEVTLVVTQDASGGRFIDWDNYIGDPDISQEAEAKTVYKIYVDSLSEMHVRTESMSGPATDRLITWPGGSPVGTGLGGGASSIVSNVTGAVWTWPQVRRYQYYGLTCLGRASSIDYTQVQTVASNAPNVQCLSFLRPDLWQFWNRYGIDNPSLQWGTFLSGAKPTAAMGDQTRDGYAWATAQAQILAEYSLNSVVSSITDTGTLLTNPYEMEFFDPGGTAEFRVQSAIMDVSDENWLELYTDFLVAVRKEWPLVKGYVIQPSKLQFYRPSTRITTYQLHEWLQGTANTGWDLATNTGGADLDGWSINLTAYDDHESTATMKVRYDPLATLSQMLREKDPHAIQFFSPYYLGVDGHRNTTYRGEYRTAYIAEFPGSTNDDADDYLAGFLSQMANTCDVVQHYTNEDSADFSTDWSQQMRRANGRFVKENVKPQDISQLDDM